MTAVRRDGLAAATGAQARFRDRAIVIRLAELCIRKCQLKWVVGLMKEASRGWLHTLIVGTMPLRPCQRVPWSLRKQHIPIYLPMFRSDVCAIFGRCVLSATWHEMMMLVSRVAASATITSLLLEKWIKQAMGQHIKQF